MVSRTRAGRFNLADAGQQHHHGADAGERQQERGGEQRQE